MIDFKKIKYSKSAMSIEVTYNEYLEVNEAPVSNEVVKKCNMIVHQDFINALNGLKIHFALLCDLREVSKFPEKYDVDKFDHEQFLDKIVITGITLGGDDNNAGIVIIGQKELPGGGILNLVTPFTRFESDYVWCVELEEAVKGVCYEAEEYLNGKWGVRQLELDFADEYEENGEPLGKFENLPESIESVEQPKKRGRKKKEVTNIEPVLEPAC